MASQQGQWLTFNARRLDWTEGGNIFNWAAATSPVVWRCILTVGSLNQTVTDPRYDASGNPNLATGELPNGTTYTAGGVIVTPSKTGHPTLPARAICTYGAGDIAWGQDAGQTDNILHAAIYNDTDPVKRAWFFFVPTSSPMRLDTASLEILPHSVNGLFQDFTV